MSGQINSVSDFLANAKKVIEHGLPLQWIKGEISGLKLAASGHRYFDLKDATAQVSCVLYKFKAARVSIALRDGLQVEVLAMPSLYEPRGSFQIMVEGARPVGLGAQHEAFLQLKAKLTAEGLFDSERKRPMPRFVRRIGIITSASGAVIHDMCTTAQARWPGIVLVLYPASVQGVAAPDSLINALHLANLRQAEDVLIIARGGGSAEDLSAFNDEALVRAVAASNLPIVSAVGHETDVTLCDFAADVRAPTPTAAATLLTPNATQLTQKIDELAMRLQHISTQKIMRERWRLQQMSLRIRHPRERLLEARKRLLLAKQALPSVHKQLLERLKNRRQMALQKWRLDLSTMKTRRQTAELQLSQCYLQVLGRKRERIHSAEQALALLGPDAVLSRGYAWVSNTAGEVVVSERQVAAKEHIHIKLKEGRLAAIVQSNRT